MKEHSPNSSVQKELVIIKGATHLFEAIGTLEEVAETARDWFLKCFSK